jgi:hypothetical protein
MPEYIKILGQVTTTAAGAVQQLSMFPDPNFEFYTAETTHNNTTSGPIFGVPTSGGNNGVDSNSQQTYITGDHSPNSANVSGRTNALRFYQHGNEFHPVWELNGTGVDKPFLKSGQVYTMSFWMKATGASGYWNSHHGHGGVHYNRGVNQYDIIPYGDNVNNRANSSHISGWTNDDTLYNNWKQFYTTFTGEGGSFNLKFRIWNHSYSGRTSHWTIDNFTLLEGAVPIALLPTRPSDGSSGNANALYTAPYTIRSEGWQKLPYQSPTIRRVTGSWQTLYTVPDNRTAVASTLHIANYGAANTTYRVAVQKAGETLESKHIFAFDHPITQTSSESLSIGLTLSAGDRVLVQADVDKITFQLFGSETA